MFVVSSSPFSDPVKSVELKAPSIIPPYRTEPDRERDFCFLKKIACLYVYTQNISGNLHKKLNSDYIWGVGMEVDRRLSLFLLYFYDLNFIYCFAVGSFL